MKYLNKLLKSFLTNTVENDIITLNNFKRLVNNLDNEIVKRIETEIGKYINENLNNISQIIDLHNGLQKYLATLAKSFYLRSIIEYKIPYEGKYNRYVDIVWVKKNKKIIVAIEIDSSLRKKSIEKLNLIKAENKVWVLYCNNINDSKFDVLMNTYNAKNDIKVIYIGALRKYLRDRINKKG